MVASASLLVLGFLPLMAAGTTHSIPVVAMLATALIL